MKTSPTERRCARIARQSARVVMELRREGHDAAAAKLEQAAIETVATDANGDAAAACRQVGAVGSCVWLRHA